MDSFLYITLRYPDSMISTGSLLKVAVPEVEVKVPSSAGISGIAIDSGVIRVLEMPVVTFMDTKIKVKVAHSHWFLTTGTVTLQYLVLYWMNKMLLIACICD